MHVEGQLASCVNAHMRHNSSIKAVRELLKLTQEKAVARAKEKGEAIGRDEWVKVETGTNKGSTVRIQKALAAAKAALVEAARLTGTQPDPSRVARLWLDAARELRLAGQPTTTAAISARIALLQRVA